MCGTEHKLRLGGWGSCSQAVGMGGAAHWHCVDTEAALNRHLQAWWEARGRLQW